MMTLVSVVFCLLLQAEPLTFVRPVDTSFAGRTDIMLRTSIDKDDIIGLEIFINGQSAHYFEEGPFEATLDMRSFPEGPVHLKAVLETFDGDIYESLLDGHNYTPDYTENVTLIRVPVQVAPSTRTEFHPQDFQIFENDRPQKVSLLLGSEKPIYLTVLLDMSTSMERRLGLLRSSMDKLIERVRPGDVMHLIGFNHRVFEVCEPETDMSVIRKKLSLMEAQGDTNIYGALWSGLKVLGRSNERRALLLFTDGDHTVSEEDDLYKKDLDQCIDLARENGVPVYSVGFGAGVNRKKLERLASETGGQAFFRTSPRRLSEAFDGIGKELHRQYLLCYYTHSTQVGWHDIKVELKDLDVPLLYPKAMYFRP